MRRILVDTGPLVALLSRRDTYHDWARGVFDSLQPPIYTCDPVLSEACFLLSRVEGGQDALLELVTRGIVRSEFALGIEARAVRSLMRKFEDVPMSLADACLVRMTEIERDSVIVTLDADYRVYRRNRSQLVPAILPEATEG